MLSVIVGVCVYNEEKNISNLLSALLASKITYEFKKIIIVSSACTDKTNEIIETEFTNTKPEILLIKQKEREGKASAINLMLKHAECDIIVLESADTLPLEDTLENIVKAFDDPKVGMSGGRPVPINNNNEFMGYTVHLIWELHHWIAIEKPKLGELIAFRRALVNEISKQTSVDEALIEFIVQKRGFELKYVPEAIVYNKGPENVLDFIKQRRRIFAGHLSLYKSEGYAPSSMKTLNISRALVNTCELKPKFILWTFGAVFLEILGRFLGFFDFYVKKNNHTVWEISTSTKCLIQTPSGQQNEDKK